jgi:integration host factor subunit beta
VTRKDIIRVISEELGLPQLQTGQIVHNVFDAIVNTLAKNGRVELRNFGVFEVRWRKARKARNPRTGEKVMVPKRCTVIFRPGQAVEKRIQSENRIVVARQPTDAALDNTRPVGRMAAAAIFCTSPCRLTR